MSVQIQRRFRSDLIVREAGRFRFAGFISAGWKPPPHDDEKEIELAAGDRFPRVGHACWWMPVDELVDASTPDYQKSGLSVPTVFRNGTLL